MKGLLRVVGVCLLLTLIIIPIELFAQEEGDTVTVVGSGIAGGLFENLVETSGVDIDVDVNINGTANGFISFCSGEADITNATRPLSVQEEELCNANGIEFAEYLIGHNILTFVTHPELDFVTCLDNTAITSIFAPTADITDWTELNVVASETPASTPLALYTPPINTPLYIQLDNLVDGSGLRADVNVLAEDSAIIEAVNNTPGALGVVSLNTAQTNENTRTVQVSTNIETGCHNPSAENVENRLYGTAERLFSYVNLASQEKTGVIDFLTFATSSAAQEAVNASGFTAPSENAYLTNAAILAGEETGRRFSLELVEFQIPDSVFGQLIVGGSAHVSDYITAITTQFTTEFPSVTITTELEGQVVGLRRLCNGEIDVTVTYQAMTDEQTENCVANNITPVPFDLGTQAVVLVANANDELLTTVEGYDDYGYLSCLTTPQLQTIFGIAGEEAELPTTWNAVDTSFPEIEMFLFSPNRGNIYSDIILTPAEGAVIPERADTVVNNDPLWRAAATANTEGGLTYMSWSDYENVLESEQANIQLVQVDAGNGCVTPSAETITSGEYGLTRSVSLVVSQSSLSRTEVQSLIWHMVTDASITLLGQSDIITTDFGELPAFREAVQNTFAEAQAALLTVPDPEATAEVTAEAEATEEANDD